MSAEANPAAPHHLPIFVTAPGETDVLFNVMAIFLIVMVLLVIIFYFTLHSLPERMAHKGQKIQFEIVAILALISLFTHNHYFWIAGLLLAFIPVPDFSTPLERMADSLGRMSGWRRPPPGFDTALPEQGAASAPAATIGDFAKDQRSATAGGDLAVAMGIVERGSARVAGTDDVARRLPNDSKESA
jgi:hypothetical protein